MNGLLWEACWKSTLLLGAALLVSVLLRRRSASLRQLVLTTAVVATLAGAALMAVVPHWTAEVPVWIDTPAIESPSFEPPPVLISVEPVLSEGPSRRIQWSASSVAWCVWLTGVAAVLTRLLIVMVGLWRSRVQSAPVQNRKLGEFVAEASRDLNIRRKIAVLRSDVIQVPIAWGVFRPVILLPAGFESLPAAECHAVLYHELEHIRRWDSLTRMLAEITCALLWFQPLAWIVRRRIREEQELACDDSVLARGAKPSSYAGVLLEWQDRLVGDDHLVAVGIAGRKGLSRRLHAILDPRLKRGPVPRLGAVCLWLIGLGIATSVATLTFADTILTLPRIPVPQPLRAIPEFTRTLLAQALPAQNRKPGTAGAVVEGVVVEDHSGTPLVSAGVRIASASSNDALADLETDSQGRFRSPDLAAGEYRLEITKPNYVDAHLRVEVKVGAPEVLARLVRSGVITGRVTDSRQQPVRGATVAAFRKPDAGLPARPDAGLGTAWQAASNADGVYRIFGIPPGQYAVVMFYGSQSPSSIEQVDRPTTTQDIGTGFQYYPTNVKLQFPAISGGEEIRGADFTILPSAAPAPSATFGLKGKFSSMPAGSRSTFLLTTVDPPGNVAATAGGDGSFQFRVRPGSYIILAVASPNAQLFGLEASPDAVYARVKVDVSAQDLNDISLTPEKGKNAKLTLRTPGGACPADVEAVLTPMENATPVSARRVTVKANAEEPVVNLAPVPYRVAIGGLGNSCFSTSSQTLDGSDPGTFTIQLATLGSIRGRLDSGAQRPSDFAVVLVANAGEAVQPVQVAFPGTDSRFEFTGLHPGKYRIAARPRTESSGSRWLADVSGMVELEVLGGGALDIELAVPISSPKGTPK